MPGSEAYIAGMEKRRKRLVGLLKKARPKSDTESVGVTGILKLFSTILRSRIPVLRIPVYRYAVFPYYVNSRNFAKCKPEYRFTGTLRTGTFDAKVK